MRGPRPREYNINFVVEQTKGGKEIFFFLKKSNNNETRNARFGGGARLKIVIMDFFIFFFFLRQINIIIYAAYQFRMVGPREIPSRYTV